MKFDRSIDSLATIFEFLDAFIQKNGIQQRDAFELQLVTEELFTNLVKYNRDIADPIELIFEKLPTKVQIIFIDSSGKFFDLNQAETYDTKQDLAKRPIGKVGIHLIRQYIDGIEYEHYDNKNTIKLIKNLRH